jgi:hypothetical protein
MSGTCITFMPGRLTISTSGTPAADGFGHPHFHALIFSPYIDQALLETLWRRAYNRANNRGLSA